MPPTPLPRKQTLPLTPTQSPCAGSLEATGSYRWKSPTLAEFIRQVEHQFGDTFGPTGLYWTGLAPDELLPPNTVRAFCEQFGVPPEDFGV